MRELSLDLVGHSYTVYIGDGLLDNLKIFKTHCVGDKVLILSNETISPLYFDKLAKLIPEKNIYEFLIPDGEIHKSFSNFEKILNFLIKNEFRRNDTLVTLGGGVVGDLGGFVAACFQRGMGFIQVPTSLLAQVDSSVGGKTAVNHPSGKNMIGAFYQPDAVFIDIQLLTSLPNREYISGLAEVVKYAILGDTQIMSLLTARSAQVLNRDNKTLIELIYHSCKAKAVIVAADETEKGNRALLNLGHTFAHAIEKVTNYQEYLHGEAVAIGMVMAINLSLAKNLIATKKANQYKKIIGSLGLPVKTNTSMSVEKIMQTMSMDKKNINKKYRLILPADDGCIIVEEDDIGLIKQAIVNQLN